MSWLAGLVYISSGWSVVTPACKNVNRDAKRHRDTVRLAGLRRIEDHLTMCHCWGEGQKRLPTLNPALSLCLILLLEGH